MEWVKLSKEQPPENVEVLVRFGNGKKVKGIRQGDWITYPPEEMDATTLMSEAIEWQKL